MSNKIGKRTPVRLVADHQLLSDMEAESWLDLVLGKAVEDGEIDDYKYLYSSTGAWGLQYVVFTVDLMVAGRAYSDVKQKANLRLNELMGDTDVHIRWVSSLITPPIHPDDEGTN